MQCSGFAFFSPFLFGICDGHSGAGSFVLCVFLLSPPPPPFFFFSKRIYLRRASPPPHVLVGQSTWPVLHDDICSVTYKPELSTKLSCSFLFFLCCSTPLPTYLSVQMSRWAGLPQCHKNPTFPYLFFFIILSDLCSMSFPGLLTLRGGGCVSEVWFLGWSAFLPSVSLPACLTGWSLLPPSRSLACRYRFLVQNTTGGKGEGEGRGQDIAYPVWGGGGGVQADRLCRERGGRGR